MSSEDTVMCLKVQMQVVCATVADDIKYMRAWPIPLYKKPHVIAAMQPATAWAVAPSGLSWPDVRNGSLGATDFRR